MSEQIKKVPAVALRGMTILPGMIAHFDVSRERSIHAVEQAMMDDEQIFLVTQRNAEENEPEAEDLYQIGILASIKQVIKMQDNIVRVLVEGTTRAQLQELFSEGTYLAAEVMTFSDTEDLSDGAKEAMLRPSRATSSRRLFWALSLWLHGGSFRGISTASFLTSGASWAFTIRTLLGRR